MKNILTVEFVNKISEIRRLGEICDELAQKNSLSLKTANAIGLSLDEVITNIISYGYDDDGGSHTITVNFFISDGLFKAVVSDDGRQFDPLGQPETDLSIPLEDKNIGGLGLHLVRSLMDHIEYNYEKGRNILTLIKKID